MTDDRPLEALFDNMTTTFTGNELSHALLQVFKEELTIDETWELFTILIDRMKSNYILKISKGANK